MSLLIPAVQEARNSVRDVTCRNRLKQIGLAVHNYADVYNMFPPGWTSRRGQGEGHPANGWQASILPFLGEVPLYNSLNIDAVYEPKDNDLSPLKRPLLHYRCTSDSLGDTNPLRGDWGTSNFSANHGSEPIPRWSEEDFWPGQVASHKQPNGIFSLNRCIRFRDITDGTSNTICVGERCVIGGSGIWPGPRSNFHESDVVSDASFSSPLNHSDTGFSSRHLGGIVYFLLCDGSVRPIHESVESLAPTDNAPFGGIMQLLAARDDGQVIRDRQELSR